MTSAEARRVALSDIVAILNQSYYNGGSGFAPSFEANRYFSEEDKKDIRRAYEMVTMSLAKRIERADKEIERQFRRES